jgi:hypothetical protein
MMIYKTNLRLRLANALLSLLVVLTLITIVITYGLAKPYDEVRFGAPNSVVSETIVPQGGLVTISSSNYCNDGQDTTVERWADLLDNNDQVVASYQIQISDYFRGGQPPICYNPAVARQILPPNVIGFDGRAGRFRFRQIIFYHPNPIRTIRIEIQSNIFTVVPSPQYIKNPQN